MRTDQTIYECDRKGCDASVIVTPVSKLPKWLTVVLFRHEHETNWHLHLCKEHRQELLSMLKTSVLKDPK